MNKIYSITLRTLLAALTILGAASCVRPDIDGCVDPRGNVRLTVSLDVDAATRSGANRYEIENATVYVFDAYDNYVASCRGERYTGRPYEFYLNLSGGSYRFVVWTNEGAHYAANNPIEYCDENNPHISELEYAYDHSAHDCPSELIPGLLYGSTSKVIDATRDNIVEVLMYPDTYDINIKVKGLPETSDDFDFSITDNNSHYTFHNTIIDGKADFKHIRTCNQQSGELNTSIRTLRLSDERNPLFVFSNATLGQTLFSKCLVTTIIDAYRAAGKTVDFGNVFSYDIVLSYDTEMDVTVSVNGWEYNQQGGDLE